jgi:hypothetical protein
MYSFKERFSSAVSSASRSKDLGKLPVVRIARLVYRLAKKLTHLAAQRRRKLAEVGRGRIGIEATFEAGEVRDAEG